MLALFVAAILLCAVGAANRRRTGSHADVNVIPRGIERLFAASLTGLIATPVIMWALGSSAYMVPFIVALVVAAFLSLAASVGKALAGRATFGTFTMMLVLDTGAMFVASALAYAIRQP